LSAFVYLIRFIWYWQHCTIWKYNSDHRLGGSPNSLYKPQR